MMRMRISPSPAMRSICSRSYPATRPNCRIPRNAPSLPSGWCRLSLSLPWTSIEGSVGAYWGLFDNQTHQPKFVWAGPITDGDSWKIAAVAVAVGVLLSLPVLGIGGATAAQALLLASAAHAVGAWAATVFDYWVSHYFVAGAAFALALGTLLLIPLVLIALGRIEEIAGILLGRSPPRPFQTPPAAPPAPPP